LFWKNWKLQSRRPWGTFFEIFVPSCLCLLLWALRGLIESEKPPDSKRRLAVCFLPPVGRLHTQLRTRSAALPRRNRHAPSLPPALS
jgi:hypothetical protein